MRYTVLTGAALICVLLGLYAATSAKSPDTIVVTPVVSADVNTAGQPIAFPSKSGHVTAAIFEIAPGASLPVHKHPFPRMGYILSGSLRVDNLEDGKTETYRAGDFVLESVGQWHRGTNPGAKLLKLLVIDLVEKGAQNTITR